MKKKKHFVSRLTFILLVITLVACTQGSGVATPTKPPAAVPKMVEYLLQADELTLRFAYPEGWSPQRLGGSILGVHLGGLLDELLAEPPPSGGASVLITVSAKFQQDLEQRSTLQIFAERTKLLRTRGLHGDFMSSSEIRAYELGELDAMAFTLDYRRLFSKPDAAIIMRDQVVVADLGSHWLEVSYTARADLFDKYQPIFDAISPTFKVERSS